MGIKISSLPNNALPYTGSEKIPLVQDGQTRGGTLSSFVNYLSGALLSDSELRALSGNWQNTYTSYTSNSANYAVKDTDNNFTNTQTISVVDTTKVKFGTFKTQIDSGNANIIFGYDTAPISNGSYNISIGVKANSEGVSNIVIGTQTFATSALFNSSSENNIAIGSDINVYAQQSDNNILIGKSTAMDGVSATNNVIIGNGAACSDNNNVIIGNNAQSEFSNCIVFGYGAYPTDSNQLAFGDLSVESGTGVITHYLPVSIGGLLYNILLTDNPEPD
jgi:hypothetical protein